MEPINNDNLNIADLAKEKSKEIPVKPQLSRGRKLAAWDNKKKRLMEQEAFRKELVKALENARSNSKTL